MSLHPVVSKVTDRICEQSRTSRQAYLEEIDRLRGQGPSRQALAATVEHREQALEAKQQLPAAVRKAKPWPRSMESVHSAIREMKH